MTSARRVAWALVALAAALPAGADEGLWTFEAFPSQAVKERYGFAPDAAWLNHLRLSTVTLSGACSGSFVSASGLVLTSEDCVRPCLRQLSAQRRSEATFGEACRSPSLRRGLPLFDALYCSPLDRDESRDYVASGFWAKTAQEEPVCSSLDAAQLVEVIDATEPIYRAVEGLPESQVFEVGHKEELRLTSECSAGGKFTCKLIKMHGGARLLLYKYRRFNDVRLVFASELAVMRFGGEDEAFSFPRHSFNAAFVRVYEDGQPARTPEHLPWSPAAAREGELIFISGNVAETERHAPAPTLQLLHEELAKGIEVMHEVRGLARGIDPREGRLGPFIEALDDQLKGVHGRYEALSPEVIAARAEEDRALQAMIEADPQKLKKYGGSLERLAKLYRDYNWRGLYPTIEGYTGLAGGLLNTARGLVRAAYEREKPDEQRLPGYDDASLGNVERQLIDPTLREDELEIGQLALYLSRLKESLGGSHPLVKKLFGHEPPAELAARLAKGSSLRERRLRKRLWDGGVKAIEASEDPLIAFARKIEPPGRAALRAYLQDITGARVKSVAYLARARYETYGERIYPDGTETLRLTYGQIKGYEENGRTLAPFTTFAELYGNATGRPPYALPERWIAAKPEVDPSMPLNFCSTADATSKDAGAVVVNRAGQVVGLFFDGNAQTLGADYRYDAERGRAIATDGQAILHALEHVYRAERLLQELRPDAPEAH